ncbi:MAG: hypothetical protein DWH80_09550 [Planctomycetota bacterium]|nr:MAG: hypothetical protein DWH80_09550 [Planctomycetota bacterium]
MQQLGFERFIQFSTHTLNRFSASFKGFFLFFYGFAGLHLMNMQDSIVLSQSLVRVSLLKE